MKEVSASSAYSIETITDNCIISKSGDIAVVFGVIDPEVYSLSSEDMNYRHNEYVRAFSHISNGYIQRQDVYLEERFSASMMPRGSFISEAEYSYFDGRECLGHFTLLSFTLSGLKTLSASYQKNPLRYQEALSTEDRNKLSLFLDEVESAVSIIKAIPRTSIVQLNDIDIVSSIYRMVNGYHEDSGLRDIQFTEYLRIGSKYGTMLSICDERFLPDEVASATRDTTLGTSTELSMGMLEPLGIHLGCSHIITQIWRMRGQHYLSTLKENVENLGRHRSFDKSIEQEFHAQSELEKEIREQQKVLCEYHYNIMLLSESLESLEVYTDRTKSIITNAGFSFYIPSFDGLYRLFIGSIIGRSSNMHESLFMLTDLDVSLCLSPTYTAPISDSDGIFFQDRVFQAPIKVDIWDERKKRIPARNAIVVASTGGGKSVTTLNIVQQLLEQGTKTIVVEFGKSFYQLGQLYPERSVHIDYSHDTPLGINPFYIPDGSIPDKEKIRTLVNLILVFWRMASIASDTPQVVSLTKLVQAYYEATPSGHSFPSFYRFIEGRGERMLRELNIEEEYFDRKSFLHVCSEFMEGGYYENVCKSSDNESLIAQKDFVIFELTRIKKDPFLVSVIMSILYDTIESKILSDRSVRGMLVFDEYAESQAIKDRHSGADIHSTVAFCYQKLRKENGAIMTIIQSPSQLPDNEYTKGILSNTQILYVLPTTNVVYADIEEKFKFDSSAKKQLMRSIRNNFSTPQRKYSEVFISFGDKDFKVVRLELSPEKFLAFQTDGQTWQKLQNLNREVGSMQRAIESYLQTN